MTIKMKAQRQPIALAISLLFAPAMFQTAFAATCTVTNLNDSGAGSLRNCIASASSGDTIDLSGQTGTISLTTTDTTSGYTPAGQGATSDTSANYPGDTLLVLNKDLTLQGPTGGTLALDGGSTNTSTGKRLIYIPSGVNVTIKNLTLQNGRARSAAATGGGGAGAGLGGGILNEGTLTLQTVIMSGNRAVGSAGSAGTNGGDGGGMGSAFAANGTFGHGGAGGAGADGQAGGFGGGGGGGSQGTGGHKNGFNGANGGFGGGGGGGGAKYACCYSSGTAGTGGFGAANGTYGSGGASAGFGAAIFARAGTLTLKDVTFNANAATSGGGTSTGRGGALFVCTNTESASCSATIDEAASCGAVFGSGGSSNTATTGQSQLYWSGAGGAAHSTAGIADSCASAPAATTNAASGVSSSGATLNGTVNDNGATTTVSFDYGPTGAYGTNVAATTGGTINAGTGNTAASVVIGGLSCGATYHFRVKGVNSINTTNGSDQTLTTSACPVINGICGGDNGRALTTTPTDLCLSGWLPDTGVTTGNSLYTWSCNGAGGGSSVTCSATRNYAVTTSVGASGNGSISISQNVAYNATPSFALVPNVRYVAAPVTGTCGGTLNGNVFTTKPVTGACTVVANFVFDPQRQALFVNSSSSANKTSVIRVINLGDQGGALRATAYDEAGNAVGTPDAALGNIAAQQILTFTSAQLESALGFTPAAPTAKYRIVFNVDVPGVELINFVRDNASGNLTLGQAQTDRRPGSAASSSVRNALFVLPASSSDQISVVRLVNPGTQGGAVTATAYDDAGAVLGKADSSLGMLAAGQMLTFTSAQLETALGFTPATSYRVVFTASVPSFELLNFVRDTVSINLNLAQMQLDDRAASSATSSSRNALLVNPSISPKTTSVVRLINMSQQAGALTVTAYNEDGNRVGKENASLGTLAAGQTLSFTSAQLEAAIGYTPPARYRMVFTAALPSFELINFFKDTTTGKLSLGQAQIDNRAASATSTSARNVLFENASSSSNKTSRVYLINPGNIGGAISATAYDEAGTAVGTVNASLGVLSAQQMRSFTSAQLEAALGYTPASPTAKYRIMVNANLSSFELVNFVEDVATGNLTLGQAQSD